MIYDLNIKRKYNNKKTTKFKIKLDRQLSLMNKRAEICIEIFNDDFFHLISDLLHVQLERYPRFKKYNIPDKYLNIEFKNC